MVRTQVQLTEDQARVLRDIAARERLSLAELVRQAVDKLIGERSAEREEINRRFLSFMGTGDLGAPDVAENHDKYLAEAYDHASDG